MPTPRAHGGAALQHIPLNLPAFSGLNRQAPGALLGPEWATKLENSVIDRNGRIATRKGWSSETNTTAAGGNIVKLIEHQESDGTYVLIASADDNKIYRSTDNGDTWADITSTATVTDPYMQWVSFQDDAYGFQEGGTVVKYTSGGSCADHSPTGIASGKRVALAAFGRLWAVDSDNTTIKYSALLNGNDWDGSDTGSVDMNHVWKGQDEVIALATFNGTLVVFGEHSIIMWTDNAGSAIGIDPLQMYVVDTMDGVGCRARDSIQHVDGDLWFVSRAGLMSFRRLISERSNPLDNLSNNVRDELSLRVKGADAKQITAIYSPEERFYLLSIPSGTTTEGGVTYCFDTQGRLQDGSARCVGIWTGLVPRAAVLRQNRTMLMSILGAQGEVGSYSGFTDNGSGYVFSYESAWSALDSPHIKIPKRVDGVFFVEGDATVRFKWAFDFDPSFTTVSKTITSNSTSAEWGISEFGIAEFGRAVSLREAKAAMSGTGEHIKLGVTVPVNGNSLAIQQLALYAKIGRLR